MKCVPADIKARTDRLQTHLHRQREIERITRGPARRGTSYSQLHSRITPRLYDITNIITPCRLRVKNYILINVLRHTLTGEQGLSKGVTLKKSLFLASLATSR